MTSNKKKFVIPQLTVHGNVETITESAMGGRSLDVPLGSIGDNLDAPIDTITS